MEGSEHSSQLTPRSSTDEMPVQSLDGMEQGNGRGREHDALLTPLRGRVHASASDEYAHITSICGLQVPAAVTDHVFYQ